MTRVTLPALVTALLLLVAARPAQAFCRAKVCVKKTGYDEVWQTEPDTSCARDKYGCQIEGKPLYWAQTCLSFAVQKDGSPLRGIDYETAHQVTVDAFTTWLHADCSGAPPSFVVMDYGAAECDVAQYNRTKPNANVIMFRDDGWDKQDDPFNTIALTTLSYDTETGELYGADVELNSARFDFGTSETPQSSKKDLQAVMTHELGHFLGLSHPSDSRATMWWVYQESQRALHTDDIAGICELFPPNRAVDRFNCAPRHGYSPECQSDEEDSGCAIGTARRAGASTALLGTLVLFGLLRRRRR
jgi:hypothetical protein